MNVARPAAALFTGSSADDQAALPGEKPLMQALDELEAIGDVAALPGGYWLPAPMRYVPLLLIRRWVLLAGRPTRWLLDVMRPHLEYNGTSRLLTTDPANLGLDLPIQPQADWLSKPSQPVAKWAKSAIDSTRLVQFDDSQAEFECYAPGATRASTQYHRWKMASRALPNGRYLARIRGRRGPTDYSVIQLENGQVVATGIPQLDDGDVRRLLYGLDSCAKQPVRIRFSQPVAAVWNIELKSELPQSEQRLFTTLGQLRLTTQASYYPRIWQISGSYAVQAAHALHELDVALEGADELFGHRVKTRSKRT